MDGSTNEKAYIINLYKSEQKLWSYLENFVESSYESKLIEVDEKTHFFHKFNTEIPLIFINRDWLSLEKLNDSEYLQTDCLTDLMLINDIINYDETLMNLYTLTRSMPFYSKKKPIESKNIGQDPNSILFRDKDLIGFFKDQKAEQNNYQETNKILFSDVLGLMKSSGISSAQKFLIENNRIGLAGILNSGLCFHDFSISDEKYRHKAKKILIEEEMENHLEKFEKIEKALKVLDFMNCKEFEDIYSERKEFYLRQVDIINNNNIFI